MARSGGFTPIRAFRRHFGVAPSALEAADLCVELPVYGMANSLNVAMACALVGYEILRQNDAFGLSEL